MKKIYKKYFTPHHLNKVFFPEDNYTKEDITSYYQGISPFILPYIKNRPQSLFRQPDGIYGVSFFQKNVDFNTPKWVKKVHIRAESSKKNVDYLVIVKLNDLLYIVDLGCIEIHPWAARVGNFNNPDYMIFDLDPIEAPFERVVDVALCIKKEFEKLDIHCFCKTSGSKGLHIYVPLDGMANFDRVRETAHKFADFIALTMPDMVSSELAISKRKGKVFIDYLRNSFGQTTVAPYSLRSKKGAPISTPVFWDEVNYSLTPTKYNLGNIQNRLKTIIDPWTELTKYAVSLEKILIAK